MPSDPQFSGRDPLHRRKVEQLLKKPTAPVVVASPAYREPAAHSEQLPGLAETPEALPLPQAVRFPKLNLLRQFFTLKSWFHKRTPTDPIMDIKLKPGVKTSELWLIVATGVIGTALSLLEHCDGRHVVVVMGILGSIYTLVRGTAKNKAQ